MSRRFIPPVVEVFGDGPLAEEAREALRVREDGYAEGYRVGRDEGHAEGQREGARLAALAHEAELAALQARFSEQQSIHAVTDALERVLAARSSDMQSLNDGARAVVLAGLKALFPVLLASATGPELAALITDALTERHPESLTVRAHPDTLAHLASVLDSAAAAGRLTLRADPAIGPGAADIAWTHGGLSFDPTALLERVAAVLHPQVPASDVVIDPNFSEGIAQ